MKLRLVLLLAFIVGGSASAAPLRLHIITDGCSADDLRRETTELSPRGAIQPSSSKAIVVEIRGLSATVAVISETHEVGRRRITAANCAELVSATAVVIAMSASQTDSPEPPVETRIAGGVLVTGAADVGGAPHVAAGLEFWRGVGSLSGELQLDLPQDVANGMISVSRAQLAITPCARGWRFGACISGRVGVTRGSGVNVNEARTAVTPTFAAAVRLLWQHDLTGRFALRVHADLAVNLVDTRLDIDDMPAWSSPRVEGLLGAGLVARFR